MPNSLPKPYPWYYRPLNWLLRGLAHLPLPGLYVLADGIYLLLAYVLRYRRNVVLDNLHNSFPEKPEAEIQRIAHEFYRHFAEVMVETLKLVVMPAAALCRLWPRRLLIQLHSLRGMPRFLRFLSMLEPLGIIAAA